MIGGLGRTGTYLTPSSSRKGSMENWIIIIKMVKVDHQHDTITSRRLVNLYVTENNALYVEKGSFP